MSPYVNLGAGDAPVAMATRPTLFVEVEVDAVPRVACFSGPDLDAGARVTGEDGSRVTLVVGTIDEVGLVERAMVFVGHALGLFVGGDDTTAEFVGRGYAMALFDEMRVDEEEFEIGFGECLLDADAVEAGRRGAAVGVGDRVLPETCRAIAALGRPDTPRVFADMADVGFYRGADLGTDRFVGAEKRHVAVGGSAGDDVDEADVVEVAEGFDDVLVEVIEVIEGLREEAVPEAGGLGEMGFAGLNEVSLVFAGGDDFPVEVVGKFGYEDGVRELLEENRREIEVAVEADAVALEILEHAEEREIGFCGGLVEPLHPVRPRAVIDDIGQMRMEREGQITCGPFCRCRGQDRTPQRERIRLSQQLLT